MCFNKPPWAALSLSKQNCSQTLKTGFVSTFRCDCHRLFGLAVLFDYFRIYENKRLKTVGNYQRERSRRSLIGYKVRVTKRRLGTSQRSQTGERRQLQAKPLRSSQSALALLIFTSVHDLRHFVGTAPAVSTLYLLVFKLANVACVATVAVFLSLWCGC